ncbi:MAG: DUF4375 domain-containing protein [Verrucomicrobia bacterium]|nr:DUF4375 domain-containing protein [Verrucomicrobiota bacterium]
MNTDLAAQRAIDRLDKRGFEALTETEKVLATVWCTAAGVGNNGFLRFYKSKRGNLAHYAPTAFGKIGAIQLAAIMAEANSMFGPAGPGQERSTRTTQVLGLDDAARRGLGALEERFYASTEDEDELLEGFLNQQPSNE